MFLLDTWKDHAQPTYDKYKQNLLERKMPLKKLLLDPRKEFDCTY